VLLKSIFLFSLLVIAPGFASSAMAAQKRPVIIDLQAVGYEQPQDYFVSLLELALAESKAPDEEIQLRFAERNYSQARWIYLAQHDPGNLVIWTMTNKQREEQLLPIRIPIFKGLFGKRVFIIRKEDQVLFDQIKTRADLVKFTAGQGIHWPDVDILQANGLPVTTAATVDSLFKMLKAKRFDYFPRGVSEAWFELAQLDEKDLVVEKNLMLVYPAAIYYFVNKDNVDLARRIETGLEMMITKGSFDEFFYSHRRTRAGLEEVTRNPRRVIYLENPDSPTLQPMPTEKYWLNLPSRGD
jgi:hypothetical protein